MAAEALAQNQTGLAQSALEHAETRLLDRSVPLFQTDAPSANPAVKLISQARQALGAGDLASARALVAQAQPIVAQEEAHPQPAPQVGLPTAPAPAAVQGTVQGSALGAAPLATPLPAPQPMAR